MMKMTLLVMVSGKRRHLQSARNVWGVNPKNLVIFFC